MINSMKKRWKLCLALAIVILVILAGLISIIVFKIDNVIVTGNERVSENLIRDNFINGPLGDNMLVLKMKDKFILPVVSFFRHFIDLETICGIRNRVTKRRGHKDKQKQYCEY